MVCFTLVKIIRRFSTKYYYSTSNTFFELKQGKNGMNRIPKTAHSGRQSEIVWQLELSAEQDKGYQAEKQLRSVLK